MRMAIHITNIIIFLGLLVLGFFMFFGLHFVPQEEPYTAEHTYILLVYVIWIISYYLQLKQLAIKNFIAVLIALVIILIIYIFRVFFRISNISKSKNKFSKSV